MKNAKQNKLIFKIKKFILKSITYFMGAVFVFSMCAMDSEAFYIPLTALLVSGAWLVFIGWANGWKFRM